MNLETDILLQRCLRRAFTYQNTLYDPEQMLMLGFNRGLHVQLDFHVQTAHSVLPPPLNHNLPLTKRDV